jgi:putative hydrolase of the HAD superfamily
VLLTNAWDHTQRTQAVQRFHLDAADFDDRHHMLVSSLERGKITLSEYLDRTVFYCERPFSGDDFRKFMFSLSQPNQEAIEFAQSLAHSGKYLMATLNNESKELNAYRIQTFRLREIFSLFVSSCFVGLRKPEEAIYQLALEITQQAPESCCFVDDRPLNLENAALLGMHTIRMQSVTQLRQEMAALGISA